MNTVTAEIDVTKPSGRRVVRDLEKHSRVVSINYLLPDNISGSGYTLEESYKRGLNKLSEHYGVDFNKL